MRKIVCFERRREERLGFVLEILALDGEVVLNQRWGWRIKRECDFIWTARTTERFFGLSPYFKP